MTRVQIRLRIHHGPSIPAAEPSRAASLLSRISSYLPRARIMSFNALWVAANLFCLTTITLAGSLIFYNFTKTHTLYALSASLLTGWLLLILAMAFLGTTTILLRLRELVLEWTGPRSQVQ